MPRAMRDHSGPYVLERQAINRFIRLLKKHRPARDITDVVGKLQAVERWCLADEQRIEAETLRCSANAEKQDGVAT